MQKHERWFYQSLNHNICVNDEAKTVRLTTRLGGQYYFSFKKYGGRDQAIGAAQRCRDRLPVSSFRGLYDHDKFKSRGESGVLGVIKYVLRGEHVGWYACWQQGKPGSRRQHKRKFHFSIHGADALRKASEFRAQMVAIHTVADDLGGRS